MAATPITLAQMLRRPYVMGVISRVKETATYFQSFFGVSPGSPASVSFGFERTGAYDIYDHSATMAQARAPKVGPAKVAKKPVGQAYATVMRFYEAFCYDYADVYGIRALGGQFGGPLDERGQTYVAKQMMTFAERQANSMEFMMSRMFRGGYSLTLPISGASMDTYRLGELGASGSIDITYPIPAGNKTTVAAGTGGAIIDASWALAGTKIASHLWAINKAAERQTGWPVKHLFLNSTTWNAVVQNTQLNTIRGTVARVFDDFRVRTSIQTTGAPRESGFDARFLAVPQFEWHVYDGVSVVGTDADPEDRTTSNTSLFIPDNVVIMTPEPGDWMGKATCAEPIRESDDGPVRVVEGMDSWSYPTNDPPGEEQRFLNNFSPVLFVPKAVYYATPIF